MEPIAIDGEEEMVYIMDKTKLGRDIIEMVIDAEYDFLVSKGIVEVVEDNVSE